jgi:hypothetical protein
MERKRVRGRFVREGLDGSVGAKPATEEAAAKPVETAAAPKPPHCRSYTRARMAEALPEIVKKFVEEAKKGSIPHAKMLSSLGGLDKGEVSTPKKRRGKSAVRVLMEKLKRESER